MDLGGPPPHLPPVSASPLQGPPPPAPHVNPAFFAPPPTHAQAPLPVVSLIEASLVFYGNKKIIVIIIIIDK